MEEVAQVMIFRRRVELQQQLCLLLGGLEYRQCSWQRPGPDHLYEPSCYLADQRLVRRRDETCL